MTGQNPEQIAEALRSGPRVAPSQHDPWTGTRTADERWTKEQVATLKRDHDMGRFANAHRNYVERDKLEALEVKLPLERSSWQPPAFLSVFCPIIARTRTGRVQIITPAGHKLWRNG